MGKLRVRWKRDDDGLLAGCIQVGRKVVRSGAPLEFDSSQTDPDRQWVAHDEFPLSELQANEALHRLASLLQGLLVIQRAFWETMLRH